MRMEAPPPGRPRLLAMGSGRWCYLLATEDLEGEGQRRDAVPTERYAYELGLLAAAGDQILQLPRRPILARGGGKIRKSLQAPS